MKKLLILLSIFLFITSVSSVAKRTLKKTQAGIVLTKTAQVKNKRQRVNRTRAVNYNYSHLPKRGAVVSKPNSRGLAVNYKNARYNFHSGVWYTAYNKKWQVVCPPKGIRIKTLPVGYSNCIVGRNTYFYYYGTYYKKSKNRFVVVEAPIGAEVASLPEGYNTKSIKDKEYYELDGIYYMPSMNDKNEEILVVVDNPNLE